MTQKRPTEAIEEVKYMEEEIKKDEQCEGETTEQCPSQPAILEEITVDEMAVDGICGIY